MKNFTKWTFFILAVVVAISGCKEDQLSVLIDESGELTVKILDEAGEPIDSVFVALYSTKDDWDIIKVVETNDRGEADFGRLIAQEYWMEAEVKAPDNNYLVHDLREYVNVVTANSTTHEVQLGAPEHIGQWEITVVDNSAEANPVSGAKVYAIQNNYITDMGYYKDWDDYKAIAAYVWETNAEGKIIVNIPANRSYTVYLENVDGDWYDQSGDDYIDKDGEDEITLTRVLP